MVFVSLYEFLLCFWCFVHVCMCSACVYGYVYVCLRVCACKNTNPVLWLVQLLSAFIELGSFTAPRSPQFWLMYLYILPGNLLPLCPKGLNFRWSPCLSSFYVGSQHENHSSHACVASTFSTWYLPSSGFLTNNNNTLRETTLTEISLPTYSEH